ncbi:MAG: hypothetical protein EB036_10575, partial [Betaproteobacteria bacterium]|nr:hypothetical protein [Betaproteobacteria bacterium]
VANHLIGNSTGGSRTLYGAGSAIKAMCAAWIEKLKPEAAQRLGLSTDDISFVNGGFHKISSLSKALPSDPAAAASLSVETLIDAPDRLPDSEPALPANQARTQ